MALTHTEIIRVLVGDRIKSAAKEYVGIGDAVNKTFKFDMFPVVTDTITMYLTGAAQVSAIATYDHDTGRILFANPPGNGHTIAADYYYYALSDEEIGEFLSGNTASLFLAASYAAAALAADASRWFSYVMGDKEVNKNDVGRKLLELSKELENKHYKKLKDGSYDAMIATFSDDPTGSPYYDYDTGIGVDTD
jgi:hypothetical protein